MFENIMNFFKRANKKEGKVANNSKTAAKERLHLVLMQDRANVSADFLELMKQEIIEVIKKYIEVDESAIDVRLTNKENADGTNGAPALYANIPILNIKNEARKVDSSEINKKEEKEEDKNQKEDKSNSSDEKKENNEENKKTSEDIEENNQAKQSEEKIEEKSETDIKENKENIEKTENAEVESKEKIKSKNK